MKKIVNVFIFRRDLRVVDNLALNELAEHDDNPILPIFIFNDKQIDKSSNKYFSKNAVEFMIQSLKDLNGELREKLIYLHGNDVDMLDKLLAKYQIHAVGFNIDYTPFARKRDEVIRSWCESKHIDVVTAEDYTLLPIKFIHNNNIHAYSVFAPFYEKFLTKQKFVPVTKTSDKTHFIYEKIEGYVKNIDKYYENSTNKELAVIGGRREGLERLRAVSKGLKNYENHRDFPAMNKTTKLSAYIKFGCVSLREVFFALKKSYGVKHGIVRELLFREFYANVCNDKSEILQGQISRRNESTKDTFKNVVWNDDVSTIRKFENGNTGFPIVDAAVRELIATGWISNRCRMILASFLVKDLFIDWRLGEQFFSKHLVDYDPSSNNAGWQWVLTGGDAQPYYRTFNPWLQAQKYDGQCKYIKKWVKELRNVEVSDILTWDVANTKYEKINYPKPMMDHKIASKKIIEKLKKYAL